RRRLLLPSFAHLARARFELFLQVCSGFANAVNVSSRLRYLRTKTCNASLALCPLARQGHLVGTATGPPSDPFNQESSLSILTEPHEELAARDAREVAAWLVKTFHQAKVNRIASRDEDDWNGRGRRHGRPGRGDSTTCRNNHRHLAANQICRQRRKLIIVTQCPAKIDLHILPTEIAEFAQPALERNYVSAGIFWRPAAEKSDHRHWLLRARRERPRRRAADERDKIAPFQSITSSARARSIGDTVRPSALAVLRLITSSKVVGCSTGRSLGLVPLRMRPT